MIKDNEVDGHSNAASAANISFLGERESRSLSSSVFRRFTLRRHLHWEVKPHPPGLWRKRPLTSCRSLGLGSPMTVRPPRSMGECVGLVSKLQAPATIPRMLPVLAFRHTEPFRFGGTGGGCPNVASQTEPWSFGTTTGTVLISPRLPRPLKQ